MKELRGFKYRFYPNKIQKEQLARTFGCSRFVYNWGLNLRTNAYYNDQKSLSYLDTSNALTKLKKEEDKSWLKEISSVPLQQGLRHLNTAFKNFFAGRNKYPNFKKKHGKQSATYAASAFKWNPLFNKLTLAKMSSPLKIRWGGRYFSTAPKTIYISKDCSDRYFVSFLVEEELIQHPKTTEEVGVDLGIKDLVITSKGFKSGNPKYYKKHQARLKTLQRRLSKKKKGSNNRNKARLKVAKLHAKISDCRKDFLHKLSTQLVRENQTICIETLSVKNMIKNRKLSKAIADCGWGELVRQLTYKSKWHDRELVQIDRWFPSSKRCSNCGHIKDNLTLDIREWICPNCNTIHDRDLNAAKNILAIGRSLGGHMRTSPLSHTRPNQEEVGTALIACGDTSDGELLRGSS